MQVLTKDNLSVEADAALYYRVNDAAQATFAVDNFLTALANLGMVTLLGAGRRLEPFHLAGRNGGLTIFERRLVGKCSGRPPFFIR